MDLSTIAAVIAGAGGLGILVWLLAQLGRALVKIAEALAAAAAVFFALWLVIKALLWALRQTLTHWRTSLDRGGTAGVVALVGMGITRHHRRGARRGARRVAADQPGVL